jgi:hypothetical protein
LISKQPENLENCSLSCLLLKKKKKKKNQAFSGMVVQAYNPSTWAGRS